MAKALNKIKDVKLLLMDVDGVLTDGKIIYDSQGNETKVFDVKDGFAIVLFEKMGYKTGILTARGSRVVRIRAKDLAIHRVYLNASPKIDVFPKILKDFKLSAEAVCYIGDDLPDYQVMKAAGFSVAVNNAVPEIKAVADYVTQNAGGHGAVREVIHLILKSQGRWDQAVSGLT